MADQALIDRYLFELRREVRWIRSAENIIEEVADHLLEAVATFTHRGLDHIAAQKRALAEFGDPTLVGRAFASSTTGGIAVPTNFTRRAGVALIASGFLWVTGMALFFFENVAERTSEWEGLPHTLYSIGSVVVLLAGLLLVVGVLGINRRHGGALGLTGRLVLWASAITVITSVVAWAFVIWLSALAVGGVLLAIGLFESDIASPLAAKFIGVGGVVAAGSAWAFELTAGDRSVGVPETIFVFGGLAIYSLGLAMIGAWLKAEEPVDEHEPAATA